MMTALQFFDITLPNLDTSQVSTQSDLRFIHNWTVKCATLRHCHVTRDDVIITGMLGIHLGLKDFVLPKYG